MFLDGIRYSIDMADEAFGQVRSALLTISKDESAIGQQLPLALLGAWGVVDSVNRLRILLEGMRGIKRTAETKLFLSKLSKAKELRDAVQHLPGEIQQFATEQEPTWGSLSWVVPPAGPLASGTIFTAVPGSLRSLQGLPAVNPLGRAVERPIGCMELSAFGHTISLSEAHDALVLFVPAFERSIAKAFEGEEERLGSDLLIAIEFEV
jgi:hypothetical protein